MRKTKVCIILALLVYTLHYFAKYLRWSAQSYVEALFDRPIVLGS